MNEENKCTQVGAIVLSTSCLASFPLRAPPLFSLKDYLVHRLAPRSLFSSRYGNNIFGLYQPTARLPLLLPIVCWTIPNAAASMHSSLHVYLYTAVSVVHDTYQYCCMSTRYIPSTRYTSTRNFHEYYTYQLQSST